jgi:hypothetical protein
MDSCCIIRQVVYRVPHSPKTVFGYVVAQAEGLSLLFIKQLKTTMPHALVVATESEKQGVFEAANVVHFPIESQDLAALAGKIQALAQQVSTEDFQKQFLSPDDFWRED